MIEVYHYTSDGERVAVSFHDKHYEENYFSRYYAGLEKPHFLPPAKEQWCKVYSVEIKGDDMFILGIRWRLI